MRSAHVSPTARRHERGFAIILVLWLIMILSAVTLTFVSRSKMDMKMVKFQRDAARADQIAKAGYRQALILLYEDALKDFDIDIRRTIVDFDDDDRFPYDGGNEAWSYYPSLYQNVEFAGGHYNVTVRDESRKLPLNNPKVTQDVLFALLTEIGVENEDDAEALAGTIVDWKDSDDEPSEQERRGRGSRDSEILFYNEGMRKRDVEEGVPLYVPKNMPFSTRDELLLVPGVTSPLYYGEDSNQNGKLDRNERDGNRSWPPDDGNRYLALGLKNYVTTYSNQVNLNTAPREVLYALLYPILGEDADNVAEDIADYRNGSDRDPYTDDDRVMRTRDDSDGDDEHFDQASDVDPQLINQLLQNGGTITSRFFEVTVLAEFGDVQRGIRAIVKREFVQEELLPFFGEETNDPDDLQQVFLTAVDFETLEGAQDLYLGQNTRRHRRGRGRR